LNKHTDFRDRLISAQQFTPAYRERYRKGLENMLSKRLTTMQRAFVWMLVVVGFAVAAGLGYAAVRYATTPGERYGLAALAVLVAAITAIRLMVALSGRVHLRWQPTTIAYITFYGVLVFAVGTLIAASNWNNATAAAVVIVPLLLAVTKLVLTHVQQSELNVREKLLELELKLSEMNEALPRKGG